MGWETKSAMGQKMLFIKMWESGDYYMSSLCEHFQISRPTGYKLIKQFRKEGERCLRGTSTAPRSIPHKTRQNIEMANFKLRKKYPDWGARRWGAYN